MCLSHVSLSVAGRASHARKSQIITKCGIYRNVALSGRNGARIPDVTYLPRAAVRHNVLQTANSAVIMCKEKEMGGVVRANRTPALTHSQRAVLSKADVSCCDVMLRRWWNSCQRAVGSWVPQVPRVPWVLRESVSLCSSALYVHLTSSDHEESTYNARTHGNSSENAAR